MLDYKVQQAKSKKQKAWRLYPGLSAFGFQFFSFFLWIVLSGCNSEFKKTDSGLRYRFVYHGNGKGPKNGEYLILNLLIKTETDSIIYNSADAGILFPVRYDTYRLKVGQKSELEEGFFMMKEGDSAIFSVKTSDVYAALEMTPPKVRGERIFCFAKLVSVLDYENYSQWKSAELEKRRNQTNVLLTRQIEKQSHRIDSILKSRNETFSTTSSGIRYSIEKEGAGSHPQKGDTVFFRYEVTYLDGTALPDEVGKSGDKPGFFTIGAERVFQSWQESIMLLRKGGSGKFYMPSSVAFETPETFEASSDSILVFNIQLVDVRRD
jgi:FKBP-type peptidyl-prolyl cis-trans isomerase FkpA